jgi:hypothetical protein
MIALITKIVWFFWSLFAPEQAKADLELVAKDFVNVLVRLVLWSFALGIVFFAGTYFLGQWLMGYIPLSWVCFFISAIVSLFFTLLIGGTIFRYLIGGFFVRLNHKGNEILKAFSILKKHDDHP